MEDVKIEEESQNADVLGIEALIDPGKYKEVDEMLKTETKGLGLLEIVTFRVVADHDNTF